MYFCYPRSAYPRPCKWVNTQTGRPLKSRRTHRYKYHTGDFAVKAGNLLWEMVCVKTVSRSQDVGRTRWQGECSPNNTAFDRETEGRVHYFSSTWRQPPSVSSVSLRLLRMQVKIGVSRSV